MKRFYTILYSIILIVMIVTITCDFLWYKEYLIRGFREKVDAIESTIDSEIIDAKHILHNITLTIVAEQILDKPILVNKLIQRSHPLNHFNEDTSIPLSIIKLFTNNRADLANNNKTNLSNPDNIEYSFQKICTENINTDSFTIEVGPITLNPYSKENIILLREPFDYKNLNTSGVLCSGLIVNKLVSKLNTRFGYSRHVDGISILNSDAESLQNIQQLDAFSTQSFIDALFKDKWIFKYNLKEYPLTLLIKLQHSYFYNVIKLIIPFIFLSILIHFLRNYINKYLENNFLKPFNTIKNKLQVLKTLEDPDYKLLQMHSESLLQEPIVLNELLDSINLIIKRYSQLLSEKIFLSTKSKDTNLSHVKLLLLEQYYQDEATIYNPATQIYVSKICNLLYEKPKDTSLQFFREVINYCDDFYLGDLDTEIFLEETDKLFKCKQSSLIETIFSIITFILRSGLDPKITLHAKFNNNKFPTITITADKLRENGYLPGMKFGSSFNDTSLLSINILSFENGLQFYVETINNQLSCVLSPTH